MSPNGGPFARTVIETQYLSDKIDQVRSIYPRLNELIDALKWRLARQPEIGVQIPNTNPRKFILKSYNFQSSEIPVVIILYSYDDKNVYMESINFHDPSDTL